MEQELIEICKNKDITKIRNKERIPIICDKIMDLWKEYRKIEYNVGFFYILDMIPQLANREGNKDPFYWEEDEWFIFINKLIKETTGEDKDDLASSDLDNMKEIMDSFQLYWELNQDLRFQQVINFFEMNFQKEIKGWILDVPFWKYFFFVQNRKRIQEMIKVADKYKTDKKDLEDLLDKIEEDTKKWW